jgi:uncharacterized protein involved in exopolysaccharide biosynthesis
MQLHDANENGAGNGDEYGIVPGNSMALRPHGTGQPNILSPTARDLVALLFRRRRLMLLCFIPTFLGVVLMLWLTGSKYDAQMKILVKRERVDPVVTTEANATKIASSGVITEEEINSEVALIKSEDLLRTVVTRCGLDQPAEHFWTPLIRKWIPSTPAMKVANAGRRLAADLKVEPMKKSDLIQINYSSSRPELSAQVLNTLGELYLAKHTAVHRPHGEYEFFHHQAEQYRTALGKAESELAAFGQQGSVAPQVERDILMQKAGDIEARLGETQTAIVATTARMREIESQLAVTPTRVNTQVKRGDNAQLMEKLKSTLLTLELKRTELASKFEPSYRPIQEVDAQIAQTRAAIAAEDKAPVNEDTTDQNPTYQWLQSELAKGKTELPNLQAYAVGLSRTAKSYREKVLALDSKAYVQQDLLRTVKAEEQNYLLYLQKREEARISDELDNKRIFNVVIAESPIVPAIPTHSPWMGLLIGGFFSAMVSVGAAFTADYLDASFRTPDEVQQYLDIPVLAAIPKGDHSPRYFATVSEADITDRTMRGKS